MWALPWCFHLDSFDKVLVFTVVGVGLLPRSHPPCGVTYPGQVPQQQQRGRPQAEDDDVLQEGQVGHCGVLQEESRHR